MSRRSKSATLVQEPAPTGTHAANGRGARRVEILDAAEAVFAEKGFVNATVRDVGDACGILSGSLYYHFDSKDAMLEEILRDLLHDLIHHLREVVDRSDESVTLRKMIEVTLARVLERPDGFSILHNDYGFIRSADRFSFVETTLDEVKHIWRKLIERGIAEGSLRADLDVPLACLLLFHSTISVVRWRAVPALESISEVADRMSGIYVDGMRSG